MPELAITYSPIGVIRTPYTDKAPYQPVQQSSGKMEDFKLILEPSFSAGLKDLASFRYIYLLYHAHRVKKQPVMTVRPPWTHGLEVGLFASRSPVRPNPIGLSVVRIRNIDGPVVYTSGLDVFDGTPLLDIKPYIRELDTKEDANYGWLESMADREHLALHIKGIPHSHSPLG